MSSPVLCDKDRCTQCGVCAAVCAKGAISLSAGDGYPEIDATKCVACGMCERNCHVLHPPEMKGDDPPTDVYACYANDENVRVRSASGGAFAILARHCLSNGWLVCGASYGPFPEVRIRLVDSAADLDGIIGSKYVYSDMVGVLAEVKKRLSEGRRVLFGCLPCQVSALRVFLGRLADNAVFCDLICHGTCHESLFKKYIGYLAWRYPRKRIERFCFRPDKRRFGWGAYYSATFDESIRLPLQDLWYVRYFLNLATLRKCCYSCRSAKTPRPGDVTLGDCWQLGSNPSYARDDLRLGWSLVICNTAKGRELFNVVAPQMECREETWDESVKHNRRLVSSDIRGVDVDVREETLRYLMNASNRKIYLTETKRCIRMILRQKCVGVAKRMLGILGMKGRT